MTSDEIRLRFNLKPCSNPTHQFKLWKLIGEWVWAEDSWSQLVSDKMQTLWFSLHTTENLIGTKIHSLIIWKLKIIVGVLE